MSYRRLSMACAIASKAWTSRSASFSYVYSLSPVAMPSTSLEPYGNRYLPGFTVTLAFPVAEYPPLVAEAFTG